MTGKETTFQKMSTCGKLFLKKKNVNICSSNYQVSGNKLKDKFEIWNLWENEQSEQYPHIRDA